MQGAVAAQGNEGNALAVGALDAAAADQPTVVGEQDDLEHQPRRVGASTGGIIAVVVVEPGEVNLMVDEVVDRVFEDARQQLPGKIDGDEPGGVDVRMPRYAEPLENLPVGALPCHWVRSRMWR